MATVEGLTRLLQQLEALADRSRKGDNVSVIVGFTQAYALFVHENLEARHPVGQAKFLEQPARELSNDGTLGLIVFEARQRGATMTQSLILAGLRLQRDSQELCPVDTGALKASAFTRKG